MDKKLTWKQLRTNFSGLWVELVDCDWDWNDANPRSAKVKNFSTDRKKLLGRTNKDSVILFIGSGASHSGKSLTGSNNEAINHAVGY